MFWNKIPKGYVETVDGYIVKESECKRVTVYDDSERQVAWILGKKYNLEVQWHRKETAPAYDCVEISLIRSAKFLKRNVEVCKDGTPIGYHTKEEVEKLQAEIKELKNKYESSNELIWGISGQAGGLGDCTMGVNSNNGCVRKMTKEEFSELKGDKPKKKKAGRPKGSKNKK